MPGAIRRFLDIGSGPGYLLEALATVLPSSKAIFHAVERFPPPEKFRTAHSNYLVGGIADAQGRFEAGTCIEVLKDPAFGPLMHTMGLESGRCYAEAAIAEWRGRWARGLEAQLQKRNRWFG